MEPKTIVPVEAVTERTVSDPRETALLYACVPDVVIDEVLIIAVPFTSSEVRFVVAPTVPPKVVPVLEVSFNEFAPLTVEVKLMPSVVDLSSVFLVRATVPL